MVSRELPFFTELSSVEYNTELNKDVNIDENNSININRIDYKGTEFEQARNIIIENFGDVEVKKIE